MPHVKGDRRCYHLFLHWKLNVMVKQAEKLGWIKGMSFGRNCIDKVMMSHILYADDTLLFFEAEKEQVLYF